MKSIYIFDAINYLFRSFYGIKGMRNQEGTPTNALFGFIRTIQKIRKDFSPDYFVAVFDGPDNKKSRSAIYEHYKAHRTGMPPELIVQLEPALHYCDLAGIPKLVIPGVEADDTMGSIAKWAESAGAKVFLISSDKDLAQLVSEKIHLLQPHKENLEIASDQVKEIYGVRPDQIIDLLAIMGDSSDNIPGISGMGPKGTTDLLTEFGSLKGIYEHIDKVTSVKKKEKLIAEKEMAFLSYELAKIQTTVEIPRESSFYHLKTPEFEPLRHFLHSMNFSSLIKELEAHTPKQAPISEEKDYRLISTQAEIKEMISYFNHFSQIAIDTETTSLDYMQADLVGIGLCAEEGVAFYIPCNHLLPKSEILHLLKPFLLSDKHRFFGHNIKYDLHILKGQGIFPLSIDFDTMIASYLLHPELNRHSLDEICSDVFGFTKTSYADLVADGKKEKTIDQVPIESVKDYCCSDADYTFRLRGHFTPLLKEHHLQTLLATIEIPLLKVIVDMEQKGIFVDASYLKSLSHEFSEKLHHLEKEIFHLAGETFNIKSPKQLSTILFEKLEIPYPQKKKKESYSTSADILEALQDVHPIVSHILEYRLFEKLRSTYVDSLPEQINPVTGRIHPHFNQCGTVTGRLSCNNPNLQNIPIRTVDGKKIRTAFRPEGDNTSYLSADYSQIELRILAHLSEEPSLIKAFTTGQDVHAYTASLVFNVPIEEVTSEMRYQAKAVNFGILYGQQAFGLSKGMNMEIKEAAKFIDTYFKRYPKVKEYIDQSIEKAIELGYSETLFGRKRPLPDLSSSNKMLQAQAQRFATNSPIQGTQSDIIKLAMIKIHEELDQKNLKSFLILQIHDELIFECPDDELDTMKTLVSNAMQSIYPMKVPLKVDLAIGKNWGDC